MHIGFCLPTFEQIATRDAIVRTAPLAEELGWESLWVTDHVIMARGQEHPYGHIFEAITTLAFAGGMTQRVKLGTAIVVLPQRNAIVFAKECASLDALTNGRLILGLAVGWNEKEFDFIGADFHRRGRLLDEQIAVMRALWTQESPSFEGRFHHFTDALFSPKPAQRNGIPIWIGGNSDVAAKRAARIGDGWQVSGMTPERIGEHMQTMRAALDGRPFTLSLRVEVDLNGRLPTEFVGPDGSRRRRLGGSTEQMVRDLKAYEQAGVAHMVLVFMEEGLDSLVRNLQRVSADVLPHFRQST